MSRQAPWDVGRLSHQQPCRFEPNYRFGGRPDAGSVVVVRAEFSQFVNGVWAQVEAGQINSEMAVVLTLSAVALVVAGCSLPFGGGGGPAAELSPAGATIAPTPSGTPTLVDLPPDVAAATAQQAIIETQGALLQTQEALLTAQASEDMGASPSTVTPPASEQLIDRVETRYQGQALVDIDESHGRNHKLPSFLLGDGFVANSGVVRVIDLQEVRDAIVADLNLVISSGVEIKKFSHLAEVILSGSGRLGVDSDVLRTALNQAVELKGSLDSDDNMRWNASGELTFALTSDYDGDRGGSEQVLVAVTHAGRARQVFTAWANQITAVHGGSWEALRQQMEGAVGFRSLNGEAGSEFEIACWRTYNRAQNPEWGDFNFQLAQFIQRGSDLALRYPDRQIGLGQALEVDGVEDGRGTMLLTNEETVWMTVKVGPGGRILGVAVAGQSDNLVDWGGVRDPDDAAAANWDACGVVVPTEVPTPTPGAGVTTEGVNGGGQPPGPKTPGEPQDRGSGGDPPGPTVPGSL